MTNNELLEIFEKTALNKPFTLSENTVNRYMYYIGALLKYLDNKSIIEITKNDIKSYLMELESSDSYYNANLSAFKTMYKIFGYHPLTEDLFTSDKTFGIISVKNVKNEKEQIFLNSYQQSMLIKYAKNSRDKAILTLYLNCGLRVHELIALTIEQYTNRSDDNRIDLVVTKGSHDRKIWLSDDTIIAIDEYLLNRKDSDCNNLFISDQCHAMDRTCISRTIKNIAKRTGIFTDKEISMIGNHSMRRSLATTLLNDKNVRVDVVAEVLGHSNLSSVLRYAKTSNERVKQAMCM